MNEQDKLNLCQGCRDNWYNEPGNSNTGQCWSLKGAKVVTRFRLGWWTRPTEPGAFQEVQTLDCHHAPGQYALYEQLPPYAVEAKAEGSVPA